MKKGTFIGIMILGIISAFFAVLGPLHEIWHWLVASLSGVEAILGWGVTYMDFSEMTLPIAFAGLFGETFTLTTIFLILFNKGHFYLATYIMGYMSAFTVIILSVQAGFEMLDIGAALTIAPKSTVDAIYYTWVSLYFILLGIQIATFSLKKGIIFKENGENRSKTLTTA